MLAHVIASDDEEQPDADEIEGEGDEATDEPSSRSEWAVAMGHALTEALGPRQKKWLAGEVGIDPAVVSRILRGKQVPSLDHLSKFAAALGVSRRRLLARAGYFADNGPDAPIYLADLPPKERRIVELVLREFGQSVGGDADDGAGGER